ncbi:MAG: HDOD domain-containing protein [Candidatus Omnitrophota bacterium]
MSGDKKTYKQTILPISADDLKIGMILAEDLRHLNGRLILKRGTSIGSRELNIIKMWGVTEALIEFKKINEPSPEVAPQPLNDEKTVNAVKDIFRFSNLNHELNHELYKLTLQRYTPKPTRESAPSSLKPSEGDITPIDIYKKLEDDIKLPSLPSIVNRINEAISNPNCTATQIADIISKDSSLTARILKLVNSAFYNFPMPIESIPRAVTIVGTRQVSALALATSVASTFKHIPPEILDMKSFWKHSATCGIICRLIAGYKENTNTESFFLAGLLHDIGRLVIYHFFSRQAKALFSLRKKTPQLLHQLEPKLLTIDHAKVGSMLIEQWKLPPLLEHACHFHHHPSRSKDRMVSSVVHVADIIANALRTGTSGEYYIPSLEASAWDYIGLPISVLGPIVQQTERILIDTIQTYLRD